MWEYKSGKVLEKFFSSKVGTKSLPVTNSRGKKTEFIDYIGVAIVISLKQRVVKRKFLPEKENKSTDEGSKSVIKAWSRECEVWRNNWKIHKVKSSENFVIRVVNKKYFSRDILSEENSDEWITEIYEWKRVKIWKKKRSEKNVFDAALEDWRAHVKIKINARISPWIPRPP